MLDDTQYVGEVEAQRASALRSVQGPYRVPSPSLLQRAASVAGTGLVAGVLWSVVLGIWYGAQWKKSVDDRQAAAAATLASLETRGERQEQYARLVERELGAVGAKVDEVGKRIQDVREAQKEIFQAVVRPRR